MEAGSLTFAHNGYPYLALHAGFCRFGWRCPRRIRPRCLRRIMGKAADGRIWFVGSHCRLPYAAPATIEGTRKRNRYITVLGTTSILVILGRFWLKETLD